MKWTEHAEQEYKMNLGGALYKPKYFISQAQTLALTNSRKDVKQLIYFQILQNADNIFSYSVIILL